MAERIQHWLDLVGAELDVSRATFTIRRGKVFSTDVEWCAEGVKPTRGDKISARIIESVVQHGIQELNKETAKELLPKGMRLFSGPALSIIEVLQQLVSIILAPIYFAGELVAIISLDFCKERKELCGWSARQLQSAERLAKQLNLVLEADSELLSKPPFTE